MTFSDDDDTDVPNIGAVFTFGKSRFNDNLPGKFWVQNDRVTAVAVGDDHTALLTESGRLFTFGTNDYGQLGIGSTDAQTKPRCVKALKSERVTLIACGGSHTLVATASDRVYGFGLNSFHQLGIGSSDNSNVPVEVPKLAGRKVLQLAAGVDVSYALIEDTKGEAGKRGGTIYAWGTGRSGELGLNVEVEEAYEPTPISLNNERVVCIAAGYHHAACVTESGRVYTWGEADNHKLGHSHADRGACWKPSPVEISARAVSIACGGEHTVVLTDEGRMYTFGEGNHGQLGLSVDRLEAAVPTLVNALQRRVVAVACGQSHTAAITSEGRLYTFGDGRHGKLAPAGEAYANQHRPFRIKRFRQFFVEAAACGGEHTIVIARRRTADEMAGQADSDVEEDPTRAETVYGTASLRNSLVLDGESAQAITVSQDEPDLNLTLTRNGSFRARERRRARSPASVVRNLPELRTIAPPPTVSELAARGVIDLNSTAISDAVIRHATSKPLNQQPPKSSGPEETIVSGTVTEAVVEKQEETVKKSGGLSDTLDDGDDSKVNGGLKHDKHEDHEKHDKDKDKNKDKVEDEDKDKDKKDKKDKDKKDKKDKDKKDKKGKDKKDKDKEKKDKDKDKKDKDKKDKDKDHDKDKDEKDKQVEGEIDGDKAKHDDKEKEKEKEKGDEAKKDDGEKGKVDEDDKKKSEKGKDDEKDDKDKDKDKKKDEKDKDEKDDKDKKKGEKDKDGEVDEEKKDDKDKDKKGKEKTDEKDKSKDKDKDKKKDKDVKEKEKNKKNEEDEDEEKTGKKKKDDKKKKKKDEDEDEDEEEEEGTKKGKKDSKKKKKKGEEDEDEEEDDEEEDDKKSKKKKKAAPKKKKKKDEDEDDEEEEEEEEEEKPKTKKKSILKKKSTEEPPPPTPAPVVQPAPAASTGQTPPASPAKSDTLAAPAADGTTQPATGDQADAKKKKKSGICTVL